MGDGELLQLAAQSDDLTDEAREALAVVMRERGLSVLGDASEEPQPETYPGDRYLTASECAIWTFADALDASEAIRILNEAGIWHRMVDQTRTTDEGLRSRVLVGLILVVQFTDTEAVVHLLREKMGLFPLDEVEGAAGSPLSGMEGTALLSMFEREEALAVAEALGRAGISYWWRDGRKETEELPDEDTVAIEVRGRDVREAQAVAEKRLAEMG
jgi:hypothetical protein